MQRNESIEPVVVAVVFVPDVGEPPRLNSLFDILSSICIQMRVALAREAFASESLPQLPSFWNEDEDEYNLMRLMRWVWALPWLCGGCANLSRF